MELVVSLDDKNSLTMDLPGLDHTFCNHLKSSLYADKEVAEATYTIKHPLVGVPTFLVNTTGKRAPKAAIKDACKRIKDENKEFLAAFKKLK